MIICIFCPCVLCVAISKSYLLSEYELKDIDVCATCISEKPDVIHTYRQIFMAKMYLSV